MWFIAFLVLIFIGNYILSKAAEYIGKRSSGGKGRAAATVRSVLNWLSFYGALLLFLLYFWGEEWMTYTLYSQGGVDVSFFLILVAFMIVSLAHRLVKIFTLYVLKPAYEYYGIDTGLGYTFNRIIYYTVMILALVISLTTVGLDLTAIAAVLGVLGIGIGFGMRNIAGNFISGVIILFERPIEVGEVIQINGKNGRVEKIRLRSTIIRTAKEGTLIVPNQYFIEQIVRNRSNVAMSAEVTVSVSYGADTKRVEGLLEKAVKKVREDAEGILDSPPPDIRLVDFKNQALEFLVIIPVTNFQIKEKVESDLRHAIAKIFLENEIELAPLVYAGLRDTEE
ncbi:mechanosensitive ion channel [Rossellomorea vietnamensis]|uniref:Mechanosensitive ion channel n=2 Tax=Bacillaceae TaxID=186817 RepID=A0A5D4MDT7_9BACI|nr:mechanosensitive ion channel [Rossellomorea vietnamensis]